MLDVIKSFKNPHFSAEVEQSVLQLIREGDLSIKKPKSIIKEFEDNLTQKFGQHCFALNNGTAALFSAYYALDLQEDDEVIIPSFVWHASISPLYFMKAKIIICDVDPESYVLDLEMLKTLITDKTKAVLALHLFGSSINMSELLKITEKQKIKVIEDCSHAIGVEQNGQMLGTFGDFGCFSLQQGKLITGGEAGFIRIKNESDAQRVIALGLPARPFMGQTHNDGASMGLKFRAHPVGVLLANHQLKNLEEIKENQNKIYQLVVAKLKETQIPMSLQKKDTNDAHFHCRILLNLEEHKINQFIELLNEKTNAFQKEDYFLSSKIDFLKFEQVNDKNARFLTSRLIYLHLPKVLTEENRELLEKSILSFEKTYKEINY